MLRRIDVALAQVADQQMTAAERVQRQETVVVIVAVEEATLLLTVQRRIGRVEVQDQSPGHTIMSGNKLIEQDLMDSERRLTIRTALEAAQGCRAG